MFFLIGTGCKKETGTQTGNNDPQWVVFNTANSSLSSNQVNAIAIDKNDVKWIGTANGLVRISRVPV